MCFFGGEVVLNHDFSISKFLINDYIKLVSHHICVNKTSIQNKLPNVLNKR